MAIIKSYSPLQNLSNYGTFLMDSNPNSDYFRITEFKETLTGGKNGFLIEGSEHLKETTEVKIEILDVAGNPIYYEPGNGVPEYYEGLSKLISVHVYEDTPVGLGKITILGELKTYVDESGVIRDIPLEWSGAYNVKWEKTFNINKNLNNETTVRFYKRPVVTIDEIVKPIFSTTTPIKVQSGSLQGIPEVPVYGTDLSNWTAGTLYKLKITDGSNFTSSITDNTIEVPSLGYSAVVKEVLNNKEVLVYTPYTINNIVSNFPSSSYTSSFEFLEGQTFGESALTGSFAKINIQQLKTFVGDVARVKVYRKSRNDIGDYQFVQESKLESTELLKDITATNTNEISYGNFTDTNLSTYWISGSIEHPITLNVDILNASLKVDYSGSNYNNTAKLITSQSFNISKDVEYTISFKTLLSGSTDASKTLKAYLSSSTYQQEFLTVTGNPIYTTRQNVTQNIIANATATAKLVLEFTGDDWYVSNVSLKNAQETSFSPDEFILIQEVPRNIPQETYDFRFEFYDINNNYIPVDVTATKAFTGGNNFPSSTKFLSFQTDRTAFRFSTGSIGNPISQTIKFSVQRNNMTGSVTYASAAFDTDGNYITPASYVGYNYPGGLTGLGDGGGLLSIANFTGSLDSTKRVGSITYTASCEGYTEFETVYRFEDGDNAPGLFVTANTNQFIYKATDLSLNPTGQIITIEAKRKNLASATTTLTINSGSGKPPLTYVSTNGTNGVDTYTLAGSSYPFGTSETIYSISGSDQFGNQFSDAIKITPIKILDGLSVSLTNENATLPALSTGFVASGSFVLTSGSVSVKVGGEDITRNEGLTTNNRFDIISASETNCVANDTTPDDATYGITSLTNDSGSLSLLVRYKDGAGDTTDVTKVITYSKAKKAAPVVVAVFSSDAQAITKSNTAVYGTPSTFTISVNEGGSNYTYDDSVPYANSTFRVTGITGGTNSSGTITPTKPTTDAGTTTSVTITYVNSEGTSGTITKTHSVSVTIDGSNGTNGTNGINGDNGTNGADGPGVVFRGIWDSTVTYYDSADYPTRRDAVLYAGTYYATKVNATTNLNKQPDTQTTFWESLGTSSYFVAAEISIVTQSYVKETLNVGTNTSGNANITIAGGTTSPYISIGQATKGYDNVGAFLGSDGTSGKLSLKSSTNSLLWDGASLTINGAGTFTGALSGGTISIGSGNAIFKADADGIYLGHATFASAPFSVTPAGVLKSTSGTIGGWTLGASSLTGGDATLASSGNITLGTSNDVIRLSADDTTYRLWIGHATAASAPFRVTKAGVLTASGVSISGAITATSGTFTGAVFASSGNFTGTVNASGGSFTGTITAADGTIGGWTIGPTALTSTGGKIIMDSSAKSITVLGSTGSPSVMINGNSTFGSFGGTYSNSGNNAIADGTTGGSPTIQTRVVQAGALVASAGKNYAVTVTETSANGTNVLTTSAASQYLNFSYSWYLRNTTTGVEVSILQDSNSGFNTNTIAIGGFGYNVTQNISGPASGTAETWDMYQKINWTYGAPPGFVTASTIKYPAGSWTVAEAASFTEIIDGGIQTGNSSTRFVKLNRSAATTMLEVGGAITATDNITAYFSDKRLKNILGNIDNPLDKLNKLNGVYYKHNDLAKSFGYNSYNTEVGVIAQEVKEVMPQVIKLAPFDNNDGVSISGENYMTVQYERLVPLLIEAIKELSDKVNKLEKGK